MLVLKKNSDLTAVTPDANRVTLFMNSVLNTNDEPILSLKDSNGQIQLITMHDSALSGNITIDGNLTLSNGNAQVNGNLTAGNLLAPLANGTSNVSIATADGNVTVTSAGNTVLTVTPTGANVSGTANITGNTAIGGNLTVAQTATVSGNIVGQSELLITGNANITSDIKIDGNALIAGNIVVQGNTTYINVENLNIEDPMISLGGGPNGAPLTTNDGKDRGLELKYYTLEPVTAFIGWDNGNSEFALAANATITNEIVVYNQLGNVRALNFIGDLSRGTSNVSIPSSSGNVNITVGGTPNVMVVTPTGANVSGTANITGNVDIGGTLTILGNVVAPNITANLANGNSSISIPAANGNINISAAGGVTEIVVTSTGANITGTANITGNVDIGSNLAVVANITAANLGGPLANGTSNVIIAAANGNVTVTSAGNTVLTITPTGANITGTANITGNTAIGGNLEVVANITAANLGGPLANGTSNVSIAAANGNVTVTSAGNTVLTVSGTGANVSGTANVTGNVAIGSNLSVAQTAIVTGNITGGNLIAVDGILNTETPTANVFTSTNTTTLNIGLGAVVVNVAATGSTTNVRGNLNVVGFVVGNTAYYGNGAAGNFAIGYRDIPQLIGNANVTLGLTDAGKHIYANSAPAFTITIPTHANVALPIGTAVSIVQAGANGVTISPQSGVTLRFAGNPAATGNRTISTSGVAALIKVENNVWYISGSGVV